MKDNFIIGNVVKNQLVFKLNQINNYIDIIVINVIVANKYNNILH